MYYGALAAQGAQDLHSQELLLVTVAGHCVADARNQLSPCFSTSAVGGVEGRSFQGAVVREVGIGFPKVAGEDRLGEEGRRLMPSFF